MGGRDPYSSSKGCAELVTSAYRDSFLRQSKIGVATVRAGNVIGGGDWAQDRLIPDILKSFELDEPVRIRNPSAQRPWQHVLEPLAGYLILAEKLFDNPLKYSGGWNFGPHDQDVQRVDWIVNRMASLWGGGKWYLDKDDNPHEAVLLKLDISKVISLLDWTPTWGMDTALAKIIHWHKAWKSGSDMRDACLAEIQEFRVNQKVRLTY
jgi:CDP-glucose 4,6-dehydratase